MHIYKCLEIAYYELAERDSETILTQPKKVDYIR